MTTNSGPNPELAQLERQIHDDISTAMNAIQSKDIHELPTAAERLPAIAKQARELAEALRSHCRGKGAKHERIAQENRERLLSVREWEQRKARPNVLPDTSVKSRPVIGPPKGK